MAPAFGSGDHLIKVVVNPSGTIAESDKANETNDEATTIIRIPSPTPLPSSILVTGSLPSVIYAGSTFTIGGQALYDIQVNGGSNTSYAVEGGLVQITFVAADGTQTVYGGVHTDIQGNFSDLVLAPAVGTYSMRIYVTDQTLSGTRELVFSVTTAPPPSTPPPAPPPAAWGSGSYIPSGGGTVGGGGPVVWTWVWTQPSVPAASLPQSDLRIESEDIAFSNDNPAPGDQITIAAQIHSWTSDSSLIATNIPISVYVTLPETSTAGSTTQIGHTVIPSLSVGSPDYGSRFIYATWQNPGAGTYIVKVEIDPSYVEQDMANNAATRAIIVGTASSGLGAISGTVNGPWGAVSGAEVEVIGASGTTFASVLTDATGAYLVSDVPVGSWQVAVQSPAGYSSPAPQTTAVSAGAMSAANFTLTAVAACTSSATVAAPNSSGWYTSPVAVTLSTSGCSGAQLTYSATGAQTISSTTTSSASFTVSTDGVTTVSYSATGGTAKTLTIELDATPPVATLGSLPAYTNQNSLAVSATVSDATSGVAPGSVQIFVTNGAASQTYGPLSPDASGNVTVSNVALTPGMNNVVLQAADVAGNITTTGAMSVVFDNFPPQVSISAPAATGNASVDFSYAVTKAPAPPSCAACAVTPTTCTVSLNGVAQAGVPCANNTQSATLTLSQQGDNVVVVTAIDQAGNTASATAHVFYDPTAPVVSVDIPDGTESRPAGGRRRTVYPNGQ